MKFYVFCVLFFLHISTWDIEETIVIIVLNVPNLKNVNADTATCQYANQDDLYDSFEKKNLFFPCL